MVAAVGPDSTAILNASGLETPTGSWSLHKHTVTPPKPGGSIALWTTYNSLVGEGGSDWVVNTLSSSVWGIWTNPSPKLQLQGLCLRPLDKGGIHLAATMGLEGCSTFSQAGNLFGGLFSAAGSMVMSMVASFTVGAGWCWLGAMGSNLFGWDDGGFLWESYALEHILIGEGEVALHLFPKLYYTPCQ